MHTHRLGIAMVSAVVLGMLKPAPPALGQEVPQATTSAGAAERSGATTGGLNLDMKLDDLVKQSVLVPALSAVVTSVNRQESTVGRSPAAIFVITPEMIKRSGVRNIPEALRMAPGIDVARINAHTWAISARGFNDRFANKLLVQIDRRIVYNATFGGVYWDVQDVVLADVDRIEVIRGPGTTAWGSNAVNGVINIITKKASETQGALVQSGGGNQERDFTTTRYGATTKEGVAWRVFGQQFDRNSGWSDSGVGDSWRGQHGGFRADYTPTKQDTVTLQGDIADMHGGERIDASIPTFPFQQDVNDTAHGPSGNVLFRYGRVFDAETSWQFQTYFDRYQYNTAVFAQTRNTYDVDLQYQFSPAEYHQFISGVHYRHSQDYTAGSFFESFTPPAYLTQWASVFAQDTMTLTEDRLYFTLGTRLEQNTFGHFQVEPTARLLFLPDKRQSAWLAVSRAVRNPTRADAQSTLNQNLTLGVPVFLSINGSLQVAPENLMAYEIGYRAAPNDQFSWDIAGFINDYRKLEGLGPIGAPVIVPPGIVLLPATVVNNTSAISYGFETTATCQLSETWRLFASYSLFEIQTQSPTVSTAGTTSPHNQVYVRSSWDLKRNVQFDLIGRYVDQIAAPSVPAYIEMDSRIGWQATKNLEFSVVGQNLIHNHHLEFVDVFGGLVSTEVRRGWYAMVSWTY